MKKLKNGDRFIDISRTEKFQITDPSKVCVNRNGISVLAIMKKLKNGCYFISAENWRYEFSVGSVF